MLSVILLGIIQGLTEFLPVSSSGHLVIIQSFFPGFNQPGIVMEVVLHLGTMFAVLLFFRKKILKFKTNYISLIAVGTIPAVVIGLLFNHILTSSFENIKLVGFALIMTAILNFLIDKNTENKKKLDFENTFVIGIFQALAMVPGISRSGATIFAGTKLGISKKDAAEFSFLLSIPAIIGANILQIFSSTNGVNLNPIVYILGFVSALFTGYFAIRVVMNLLKTGKFGYFGVYCLVLGVLTILYV